VKEPLRRLEIRLPANHPVFFIELGKRNQVIREWLDLGRRLAAIEELLSQGVVEIKDDLSGTGNNITTDDKQEFLSYFG
jgi:hypothetical protein